MAFFVCSPARPVIASQTPDALMPAGSEQQSRDKPGDAPRSGTTWTIKPGDTLSSIARAIFPREPAMQEKLIRAIVSSNPHAFPGSQPGPIAEGTVIFIPHLRTLAAETPAAPRPKTAEKETAPFPPPPKTEPSAAKSAGPEPRAVEASPVKQEDLEFRLKLSSDAINLDLIGKLSEADRKYLKEKLALLDSDDPIAGFVALKNQIKQLETQLAEVREKSKQSAASPAPVAQAAPQAAKKQDGLLDPDTLELIQYSLTLYLLPAAQATLVALALFFVVRFFYNLTVSLRQSGALKAKLRRRALTAAASASAAPTAEDKPPPGATQFDKDIVISANKAITSITQPAPKQLSESEAIIEEAQLYVIHGHPDLAVRMLLELLTKNRNEFKVWMLLFVIFRSQELKEEFEKLAKRFSAGFHEPELWENIQNLGHEMDPTNPVYINEKNRNIVPAAKRAAIAGVVGKEVMFDVAGQEAKPGEDETKSAPLDFLVDASPADKGATEEVAINIGLPPLDMPPPKKPK